MSYARIPTVRSSAHSVTVKRDPLVEGPHSKSATGRRVVEIRRGLTIAKERGEYTTKILPFLTPREKEVVEKMVFGTLSCAELARESGVSSDIIFMTIHNLLQFVLRYENTGTFKKRFSGEKPRHNKIVTRAMVRDTISAELAKTGETLDELIVRLKLNKTNTKILKEHILAEEPIPKDLLKQTLGVTRLSVFTTCTRIYFGIKPEEKSNAAELKIAGMSDAEIIAKLNGYKNATDARSHRLDIYIEAKKRGLTDALFPPKYHGPVKKLKVELRGKDIKDIEGLRPAEIDIVEAISKGKPATKHGGRTLEVLLKKVNGIQTRDNTETLIAMRKAIKLVSADEMTEIRKSLNSKELAILDSRVNTTNDNYKTHQKIASRFGVTSEAIRIWEKHLLIRIVCIDPRLLATQKMEVAIQSLVYAHRALTPDEIHAILGKSFDSAKMPTKESIRKEVDMLIEERKIIRTEAMETVWRFVRELGNSSTLTVDQQRVLTTAYLKDRRLRELKISRLELARRDISGYSTVMEKLAA